MQRLAALTLLFLFTCAMATTAVPPDPAIFRLDPVNSDLSFEVRKMGFFSEKGHFDKVDAILETGANNDMEMHSFIDVASITLSNDDWRQRLLGEDWFNAEDYPQASFHCANVVLSGPQEGIAEGKLTIRGVTQPAIFAIHFENDVFAALREGETFGFTAKGNFNRSDFGMTQLPGIVGDTVSLDFTGRFERQQDGERITEFPE